MGYDKSLGGSAEPAGVDPTDPDERHQAILRDDADGEIKPVTEHEGFRAEGDDVPVERKAETKKNG